MNSSWLSSAAHASSLASCSWQVWQAVATDAWKSILDAEQNHLEGSSILRCIDLNRNQPSLKDRDLCKFTARNLGVTEEKTFLGEYIIASAQKLTSTAVPCFAEELTQARKGELQAHSSSNESMPKKQNVDCHVAEDKSAEAKPNATKGKSKNKYACSIQKEAFGKRSKHASPGAMPFLQWCKGQPPTDSSTRT